MGVVARAVKKLLAGLLLWKAREGTDLKAVRDATERVEVSLNGCRRVKAILSLIFDKTLS
jgi:hypothetical protein